MGATGQRLLSKCEKAERAEVGFSARLYCLKCPDGTLNAGFCSDSITSVKFKATKEGQSDWEKLAEKGFSIVPVVIAEVPGRNKDHS